MLRLVLIGFLCLTGCRAADTLPPTATTLRVVQATQVPTVARDLHAVASPIPEVTPTPGACQPAEQPTTRHIVRAEVSYQQHRAYVRQHVRTVNRETAGWNEIVFDVEPNRFAGIFTLNTLTANREVLSYELTGRRLTVELAEPLEPGCAVEFDLDFTITVPLIGQGIGSSVGYLGYSENQLNLGQWLPALAYRSAGEWITHEVVAVGEQTVIEVADWDVTVLVGDAPDGLVVAAPGTVVEHAGNRWRYSAANAREFTVSMSPHYERLAETAANGVEVEVYTFADGLAGGIDNAQQALDAAAQALTLYADLFGAFPYPRFVVVQGDFPDGMEFSGIVFVSDQWFRSNNGTPESYLTIITVHETSHQWWYARVGSDQALEPWLDEAFATYSEYVFYSERYPDLKDWWWNFRVNAFVAGQTGLARVDTSVYEFNTVREYINAVYLRGAHLLDDLRDDLGTDAFFDWLRRYAHEEQDKVVTSDALWLLLTPEQLEATRETRGQYLKDSGE